MVAPTASLDIVLALFPPEEQLLAKSDASRRGRLVVLFSLVVFAVASAYGVVFPAGSVPPPGGHDPTRP